MPTTVTNGIRVSVKVRFAEEASDPKLGRFLFAYRITIANEGQRTVQLLRRRWTIWDSLGPVRQVEGPGVVGETPVLAPGGQFTYTSQCDLRSGLGRMVGTYTMWDKDSGERFAVDVPEFDLHYPFLAN
ncbi:MAG TPA: Co2+/Mg2+ efflux protein ApaG [Flavobacteriales bacterium]|nr:Co2+/Mg2+ efflux protein ApaG [Flavobacteriales bacterium]HQW85693.1 Co2+/Mg2+ efflux protein ApaG [Flavobacteriales bacterium]